MRGLPFSTGRYIPLLRSPTSLTLSAEKSHVGKEHVTWPFLLSSLQLHMNRGKLLSAQSV